MNSLKISIIIPTYNRAEYLERALKSAIAQDYDDFEIFIMDNASEDNTAEVVSKYLHDNRIKYVRQKENIGMVKNWRNAVFDHINGDWFIILSDDDYFIDNSFLKKASNVIKEQDLSLVVGEGIVYCEDLKRGIPLKFKFNGIVNGKDVFLSRGKTFPADFILSATLFNTTIAKKTNAFHNVYNLSCDSELFLNSCLFGNVAFINNPVAIYTVHRGNLLNKVYSNINFAIGNLDYLINPYQLAIKKNLFSDEEKRMWVEHHIIENIKKTAILMLLVGEHDVTRLKEYVLKSLNSKIWSDICNRLLICRCYYCYVFLRLILYPFRGFIKFLLNSRVRTIYLIRCLRKR